MRVGAVLRQGPFSQTVADVPRLLPPSRPCQLIVVWQFYHEVWFYRFYPPIIVFLSGFIFHFGLTWNGQDGEEDKAVQRGRKDFTALRGAKFYFPPILELYPAKHHIHETSLTWPGCWLYFIIITWTFHQCLCLTVFFFHSWTFYIFPSEFSPESLSCIITDFSRVI